MRLAATRSSMSARSTGPADTGAVCAAARVASSAAMLPPRNARRPRLVDGTASESTPPRQGRAEILERVEERRERRCHGFVAAADEADVPHERRYERHGGEPARRNVGLHGELGGHREAEPRLHELLHRLRVAELHRRACAHACPREPRIDLTAHRAAAVEEDERMP